MNSGSSANLLAVSALTSPKLGDRRLSPGDEVITVAAGFPTTINPILQNNLVPVFVDVTLPTYNADVTQFEQALSPRTPCPYPGPHTGQSIRPRHGAQRLRGDTVLWLIEDSCDALGATYRGRRSEPSATWQLPASIPRTTSRWERAAPCSPTPTAEDAGGIFRDWGRDCWCDPGKENTCGKRFDWQLGDLPCGYDHKYTYSHIGYNLKMTDMQAAIGLSQLENCLGLSPRDRRILPRCYGVAGRSKMSLVAGKHRGRGAELVRLPNRRAPGAPFSRNQVSLGWSRARSLLGCCSAAI